MDGWGIAALLIGTPTGIAFLAGIGFAVLLVIIGSLAPK
jgi:hypothetical protein